jgi:hypothetical protein
VKELEGALLQAKRTNEEILNAKWEHDKYSAEQRMENLESTINELKHGGAAAQAQANGYRILPESRRMFPESR